MVALDAGRTSQGTLCQTRCQGSPDHAILVTTDGGSRKHATCLSLHREPVELAVGSSSFFSGNRHILIWTLMRELRLPVACDASSAACCCPCMCVMAMQPPASPASAQHHCSRQCDPRPRRERPSQEGPGAPVELLSSSARFSDLRQCFSREQLPASPAWLPSLAEPPDPSDP